MKYQNTKTNIIDCSRKARGTSQFAAWVKQNFDGKFLVSVEPIDIDGNFSIDPLKTRGYTFSGAGADHVERGLLAGKKTWFKSFDNEESAIAEEIALTEDGI